MAILWQSSLVPFTDPNGDPYSGAKAYFYDASTTTPRTTYADSDLGVSNDHPVVANASGVFGAVFLAQGADYRVRITDADGATLIDLDGISIPTLEVSGGGGGDTPVELLFQTGMYIAAHRIGSMSGWVRSSGRTIGDASSGGTERANADCEDLFTLLWSQDDTLTVSGGRGANAASDWAASKTIALPDLRLRGIIGMAAMGSSTSSIIGASTFDNSENGNILGATVGAGTHTLTVSEMPEHNHDGTAQTAGAHVHGGVPNVLTVTGTGSAGTTSGPFTGSPTIDTTTSGSHSHSVVTENQGGDGAHANVQPSMVATIYIKL